MKLRDVARGDFARHVGGFGSGRMWEVVGLLLRLKINIIIYNYALRMSVFID